MQVFNTYSGSNDDDDDDWVDSPTSTRKLSIKGAIKHARPRPIRIPRVESDSYAMFKQKQECALRISIHETFDREIGRGAGLSHLEIGADKLTILYQHSQSKLSTQELADLQKATHFDKKELQQWYKGMRSAKVVRFIQNVS